MKEKDRRKQMNPNDLMTPEEKEEQQHANARLITRVSLRTIMPNAKAVFVNLFKTLEVVEPTYKDVILLYRCVRPLCMFCKEPALDELQRRGEEGAAARQRAAHHVCVPADHHAERQGHLCQPFQDARGRGADDHSCHPAVPVCGRLFCRFFIPLCVASSLLFLVLLENCFCKCLFQLWSSHACSWLC